MINWRLRLQNKTTLYSIIFDIVLIIFTLIELIQSFPSITPEQVMKVFALGIEVLVLLGIVIDPTTEGIKDSNLAMTYENPRNNPLVVIKPTEENTKADPDGDWEVVSEVSL